MALRVNEYRNNQHQEPTPRDDGLAQSFGSVASEYHRLRLGPPAPAVDWLIGRGANGTVNIHTAVELGAGTGHFSRALVRHIPDLYVVEPDGRMREIFRDTCPGAIVLDGMAEEIPLEDRSVDAVFAADAWHWFNRAPTFREIARVLRPGGWLGVSWNLRDSSVSWLEHLFSLVDSPHEPDRRPGVFTLPDNADFNADFTPPERTVVKWTRPMSPTDLVDLLCTYSIVLSMTESERTTLRANSYEYIATHPQLAGHELIDVPLRTVCWRTRLER